MMLQIIKTLNNFSEINLSANFLILYSFFRFVIEFFREPDQQLGYLFFNLSMGQIISCIALTCGLIIIYYKNANRTE